MAKIKTVRIVKTRYGTYSLHYINPDSRRRRLSVGKDYQHAQRLAVKFTDWLLEGKDPEIEQERVKQLEKAKNISIQEFYPIFMERYGRHQSKNMQSSYQNSFKNICRCKKLAGIPINSITISIVLDYMYLRIEQDSVKPATVNKEANFIKGMLSRAVEWDILERNLLQRLKMFPEAEKRRVELTPEQAEKLTELLPETVANIVEFAIYSGFRKENILSLKIESIRFHDITKTADVELTIKGGRTERFPLGTHAVKVLKRAIGNREKGFVFINPATSKRYISINKTLDRAIRKLKLTVNNTKLRFHDLRHVFCTWLLRQGVSIDAIRELAGHRNRSTTDRYATLNRMEVSKYLSLLPEIKRPEYKEIETLKNGKNWQGQEEKEISAAF